METNPDPELPIEVIDAIRANRKIEAIKLLREHWGMGLKEAKQAVDDYVRNNPQEEPQETAMRAPQPETSYGRFILVGVFLVGYLIYRYGFN